MNSQAMAWEKIFAKHISNKELLVRVYKEFSKLSSKNRNKPFRKWVIYTSRSFTEEDIHKI